MATSPIYGWAEPDNTDLVKNGALAIRTLGNAIDTTMGTMVAKTIIDAKGDLIAGSAADTALRLAVGANGETLVADSSTSTGLRYQGSTAAGRNFFINGGMDIWQRGTSIACSSTAYGADRWQAYRTVAGATMSRQVTNDTTNLPFIQYAARVQRDSGNTATTAIFIGQSLETVNSIPLVGKSVTFSFYARAGANYSAASSALSVIVSSGTGTDQNVLTSYTAANNFISQTATLTTTWQRFTYTGTVPTTAQEVGTYIYYTPVGAAGANDYFEITGLQLEVGSVATQFSRAQGTIQGELAACQRYYVRFGGNNTFETIGTGLCDSTTSGLVPVTLPVTMRVVPSAVDFSTLRLSDSYAVSAGGVSVAIQNNSNSKQYPIVAVTGGTGLTQNRPIFLQTNNSTSGYLGFSAEL